MKYAGILNDKVIIVKETNVRPHFPNTNDNEEVITVECDDTVQVGDEYINGEIVGTNTIKKQTQLDRIEEAVSKTRQDIIDEYTLLLIEEGVI